MDQIAKLLAVASGEIGVSENPKGSKLTKYGEAYGMNGVDWCMQFVWYCFYAAGLAHLFYDGKKTASCTTLMNWAKSRGLFVTSNYQPGDVFLYQYDADSYADHTGIYTGTKDGRGRFLVIEGNYNYRVETVSRAESSLWGAFRPKWSTEAEITPSKPSGSASTTPANGSKTAAEVSLKLPTVSYGDKGASVRAMQILLMGNGQPLSKYGADGEYGDETKTALLNYQRARKLGADGICGKDTWTKLLKG